MIFHLTIIITTVFLLEIHQSSANPQHRYNEFLTKNKYRNEQPRGRVIFHRSIGSKSYYSPQAPVHSRPSRRQDSGYYSQGDQHSFNRPYNYNTLYNQYNAHPNRDGPINNKRIYGYINSYNNPRKQFWDVNREKNIAHYVETYNYKNNIRPLHQTDQEYVTYQKPIEDEIEIEEIDGEVSPYHSKPTSYEEINPPNNIHKNPNQENLLYFEPNFNKDNQQFQEQQKRFHYNNNNNQEYDESDSSIDKNIDPDLLALAQKLAKEYLKRKLQRKNENKQFYIDSYGNKKQAIQLEDDIYLRDQKDQLYNMPQIDRKSNFVINQRQNKIVFPGPINLKQKVLSQIPPFKASPQFQKYSEVDPLYHPNKNPFETHEMPHPINILPTLSQETPTTSITTVPPLLPATTTNRDGKYPDSINAQLPLPNHNDNTKTTNIDATAITPQATGNIFSATESMHSLPETESISNTETRFTSSLLENEIPKNQLTQTQLTTVHSHNLEVNSEHKKSLFSQDIAQQKDKNNFFFLPTAKTTMMSESSKQEKNNEGIFNTNQTNTITYRQNYVSSTLHPQFQISNNPLGQEIYSTDDSPTEKTNYQYGTENEFNTKATDMTKENENFEVNINIFNSSLKEEYTSTFFPYMDTQKPTTPTSNQSVTMPEQNLSLKKYQDNINDNVTKDSQVEFLGSTVDPYTSSTMNKLNNISDSFATENIPSTPNSETTEKTYILDDNTHYIMSILNQARTHEILSQNHSNITNCD